MKRIAILLTALMTATPVFSQGTLTLIGPTIRNGSFEDGVPAPWGGINAVTNHPALASHGSWFAVVGGNVLRTDSWQYLPVNPDDGNVLILSFDARLGSPVGASVSCFINARKPDGSSVLPVVTWLLQPVLSESAWGTYRVVFDFPVDWGATNVRPGIGFDFGPTGGKTPWVWLDNVVLQQIPEPSTWALLGLGVGGLVAARRFKRRDWAHETTRAS